MENQKLVLSSLCSEYLVYSFLTIIFFLMVSYVTCYVLLISTCIVDRFNYTCDRFASTVHYY
jgi:hypothetical protein